MDKTLLLQGCSFEEGHHVEVAVQEESRRAEVCHIQYADRGKVLESAKRMMGIHHETFKKLAE